MGNRGGDHHFLFAKLANEIPLGDSSRDLLIPDRWRSPTTFGHKELPGIGTRVSMEVIVSSS